MRLHALADKQFISQDLDLGLVLLKHSINLSHNRAGRVQQRPIWHKYRLKRDQIFGKIWAIYRPKVFSGKKETKKKNKTRLGVDKVKPKGWF